MNIHLGMTLERSLCRTIKTFPKAPSPNKEIKSKSSKQSVDLASDRDTGGDGGKAQENADPGDTQPKAETLTEQARRCAETAFDAAAAVVGLLPEALPCVAVCECASPKICRFAQ